MNRGLCHWTDLLGTGRGTLQPLRPGLIPHGDAVAEVRLAAGVGHDHNVARSHLIPQPGSVTSRHADATMACVAAALRPFRPRGGVNELA